MPKTDNGGQATWRAADRKYREAERARRQANARRRAISAEAAARGVPHEVVREEWEEQGR